MVAECLYPLHCYISVCCEKMAWWCHCILNGATDEVDVGLTVEKNKLFMLIFCVLKLKLAWHLLLMANMALCHGAKAKCNLSSSISRGLRYRLMVSGDSLSHFDQSPLKHPTYTNMISPWSVAQGITCWTSSNFYWKIDLLLNISK